MYEPRIGWRYLFGATVRQRGMLVAGCVALLVTVIGLVLLLWAPAEALRPVGMAMMTAGILTAAVCLTLAFFSVFTAVSVIGVAWGVAALTTVLAITTGFQQQFRDKVLGVNAHVIVLKSQSTFAEYREVMAKAQAVDPDVVAVQPFIFAEMLATRGKGELSGVAIKGIDPKLVRGVLDLDQHMVDGTIDSLNQPTPGGVPPVIIGKELAHKLKAKMGDEVTVVVPLSNLDFDSWRAKLSAPRTRKFRVTGIFYSGFDEYDRRLMYTALPDIQELVGRGDQVMGVELKVRDVDRADEIASELEKALGGPPYQVQDWYELNHNLFTALNLQKLALVIIMTIIIIVAAVNMVSALMMTVIDKTREIAILKSMGASSRSVGGIFVVVGTTIGLVGTVAGIAVGLTTCLAVSEFGYRLDPKVYLIDKLPIDVRFGEVLLVVGVTMVISLVAALVPAWRASSLTPVEGLRYD